MAARLSRHRALAIVENQVLQQKCALGRVGDRRGEGDIGFGAALDAGQVEAAHRLNIAKMAPG